MKRPGPWFGMSVCIERITQRSSANWERRGKRLLISSPDCPQRRNLNGDGIRLKVLRSVLRFAAGGRCPAWVVSAGLGSNVSTCDGPPFMNRWISRFARGRKCGIFASIDESAASAFWSPITAASPSIPVPVPISFSRLRRDIVMAILASIDVEKGIARQDRVGEALQTAEPDGRPPLGLVLGGEKRRARVEVRRRRRA